MPRVVLLSRSEVNRERFEANSASGPTSIPDAVREAGAARCQPSGPEFAVLQTDIAA